MSQESHLNKLKLSLIELGIQLMVPKCLKNNPQMILMLLLILELDKDVVNKLIRIGLEYPMHEIHECHWRIHQPEGHHCELEMPILRPKRCLRDISLPNSQLMVIGVKVYLGVDSRPFQMIKQVINPQQWIPILDRNFVQLSLVNAQSKSLVLLLRKQNQSTPW